MLTQKIRPGRLEIELPCGKLITKVPSAVQLLLSLQFTHLAFIYYHMCWGPSVIGVKENINPLLRINTCIDLFAIFPMDLTLRKNCTVSDMKKKKKLVSTNSVIQLYGRFILKRRKQRSVNFVAF